MKSAHPEKVIRPRAGPKNVETSSAVCVCDDECEKSDDSQRRASWTERDERGEVLPSVKRRPVVHRLHGQSVAPPHGQLHARCHSYHPGAEKTVR